MSQSKRIKAALKAAGYVKANSVWVTPEERDLIAWMAKKHYGHIISIIKKEKERGEGTDKRSG